MLDLTDREERLEALHHLLNRLPALNYAVFERLIFHLARFDFNTIATYEYHCVFFAIIHSACKAIIGA